MAKDRQIVDPGGVVAGKKTYKRGQEDALAAVISVDTARQLVERNVIQGDWSDAGSKLVAGAGSSEVTGAAPRKRAARKTAAKSVSKSASVEK